MWAEREKFRKENPDAYFEQERQSSRDLKRLSVISATVASLLVGSLYLTQPEFAEKIDKILWITADVALKTLMLLWEWVSYVRN